MAHARPGRRAGIVIKNNSISDPRSFSCCIGRRATACRSTRIVRGICCLQARPPGRQRSAFSVRSVVGRFLEHSRIYAFENGGSREIYIGSADLMERNLDRQGGGALP